MINETFELCRRTVAVRGEENSDFLLIQPMGDFEMKSFGTEYEHIKKCGRCIFAAMSSGSISTLPLALRRIMWAAIESHDNMLYVLDSRKNSITVFKRTAFGEIVTKATNLYNDGYYEESYEPWLTVIKYDGNYRRAYIGIGNALLNAEQYKDAMKYFKISISRVRYNRAYEGYRGQILEKYFTPAILIIIIVCVVVKVLKTLSRKGIITFPWQRRRGA